MLSVASVAERAAVLKAMQGPTPVLAWNAARDGGYRCPSCAEPVVLKHGTIVTPHFAHRPLSTCSYGVGESDRHLAMKRQMGALFSAFNRGAVDYEVPLVAGRRADLIARPYGGAWVFVVECQASAIAVDEWERRTSDYNRAGFSLLWVWDVARLGLAPTFLFGDRGRQQLGYDLRIPSEIRLCHDMAGDSTYSLDTEGIIRSTHLDEPEARWNEFQGDYVPKTKRRVTFTPTWLEPEPYSPTPETSFVHLGEETWWTPSKDPRISRPLAMPTQPFERPAETWWKP